MVNNPSRISRFWQELKRRRVIYLITVYASASFIIIELTNNVVEPLNLPVILPTIVIAALAIGFPIAIIISWIFDVTPKGIKKTKSLKEHGDGDQTTTPNSWRIATYVSIVIIAGLVLFNILDRNRTIAFPSTYSSSIAVLPFVDMSPQGDQEYFCDGMSEEIINSLAHIESLKVIARTSAFSFKGQLLDIREIGNKLEVETILEGSIRKEENRFRITAQLIKVSDGSHLWSESYDRDLESVFEIQEEIALAIVDHLKVKLLGIEKEAIVKHYTDDAEAYNLYLKGLYYRSLITPDGFQKGIEYFEQAINKDPNFALAYAGLAHTYQMLSYGLAPSTEVIPKAINYANKALELDSTLANAYNTLGSISINHHWNWDAAERFYSKALQVDPDDGGNLSTFSVLYSYTGRYKEAIDAAIRGRDLDPLSKWTNYVLGFAYYHAGQYDQAIAVLKDAVALDPSYIVAQYYLGQAYRANMMQEEAISEHEELFNVTGGDVRTTAVLAITYYAYGEETEADSLFENLKERSQNTYVSPSLYYLLHKARGEEELAYEYFRQAVDQRDTWLLWVIIDPIEREHIPDEPRYLTLLERVGLDD